jgi:hypothetical protein
LNPIPAWKSPAGLKVAKSSSIFSRALAGADQARTTMLTASTTAKAIRDTFFIFFLLIVWFKAAEIASAEISPGDKLSVSTSKRV